MSWKSLYKGDDMDSNSNVEDEFFIIESDKIETVDSKLYGYLISDNCIVTNELNNLTNLSGNGAYINIQNDSSNIIISQDFNGSYGLYLYENGDYFAISNSFLKLLDFIKEKFVISLNENFSKSFLSSDILVTFNETMINEIKRIPKDIQIIINKNDKKIIFEKVDYKEKSVELNSEQGINLLDAWFDKWINILRNLTKQSNSLSINLNDSKYSGILISLLINANIDLKNLKVLYNSTENQDDLRLSSLSNFTGITFKKSSEKTEIKDINSSIEKSFYTKLGTVNQMNFDNDSNCFSFIITDDNYYFNESTPVSIEDLIIKSKKSAKEYSNEFEEIIENYYWENIHKIQKHIKSYDVYSPIFLESLYKETLFRNKLGKNNVETYLYNKINLNPLTDSELQKLTSKDQDLNELLFTTILLRYSPDLINISFATDINQELVNYVNTLNQKYPFNKQNYEYLSSTEINNDFENNTCINSAEINDLVTKTFFSNNFKHSFLKHYSLEVYDNIARKRLENESQFLKDVYATIAIVKVLSEIEYSHIRSFDTELDWLKTFVTSDCPNENVKISYNHLLRKYVTARIDIKNEGTFSSQVKIYDISDNDSKIDKPDWFTNEKGEGICISSDKMELHFKIKCINDGILKMNLRTLDIRDRNNKRFPIYIDYLSFKVDGSEYLKGNKLIWHDEPFKFSKKVYNNEVMDIALKWKPFNNLSEYK